MGDNGPKQSGGKIAWIKNYICLCRAAFFVTGMIFCYKFVDYTVVTVLVTYFNQTFKRNALRKSVAIVTTREGLEVLLTVVINIFGYSGETGLRIILFSTAAYLMGLVVLYLSSVNLVPNNSIRLYLFVMLLIAFGGAGGQPILKVYLGDQLRAGHEEAEPVNETGHEEAELVNETQVRWQRRRDTWVFLSGILVVGTAPWFFSNWARRLKYSMCVMATACFLFLCGTPFYHQSKPTKKSPSVVPVLRDAFSKRHHKYPDNRDEYNLRNVEDPDQVFKKDGNQLYLLPQVRCLRWLDKAAIIGSSAASSAEEQQKECKACTVKEVEEVKVLLKMIPMWSTFIAFSMALSIADTFFSEQAENMEPEIDIIWFFLLKSVLQVVISNLYDRFLMSKSQSPQNKNNDAVLVRIGLGMMLSVLCLAVAWLVEDRRLKIVYESAEGTMSRLWLLPQFCLWGFMEGLAIDGLDMFLSSQLLEPAEGFGSRTYNAIPIGLGSFLNGICVFRCRSWFHNKLNSSHLDNYYLMSTVIASINLCWFIYVSTFYT